MSRCLHSLFVLALLCLAAGAGAEGVPAAAVPPPAIAAKSYFLVDVLSGQTLVTQNADEPREPASLTKLMTAYLVFRALKDRELVPSQMVTVSERAWRAEGSRMFIEPKKAVSVDELLRGEIVQSGNDAAIALAEAVAGSENAFVERMNREAARLGM
ncbi:MAG TPA: serine hydrolase, partial [Casimicrobiaceae bacterium]|nr:serine hydrolase [Casimicrobiaceae bacterium]